MNNIIVDKGSKRKLQLTSNNSEIIHGAKKILHVEPIITVSYKAKTERKKEQKIAEVDKKQDPEIPINRPKQIHEIKLKKGKIKIQKYIQNIIFIP
jgi:hypothetical protein